MRNPYDVLGLQKGANEAEVKKAFRRAAKQHHPDQNQNDPRATERFAEVNSAYEILGDTSKRAQFDRGEIDAAGKPRFQGFGGGFGGGGPGGGHPGSAEDLFRQFRNMGGGPAGGQGGFDGSDIFGRMFNETAQRSRGQQQRPQPQPGVDAQVNLSLTLEDIASGEPKRVRLPTGRDLEVAIPKQVTDGMTVRLRSQGYSSPTGGEPGDAMLTIRILPHDQFTVEGNNLRTRIAVALEDAVLGGPVVVPTLGGGVEMAIPAMTSGGKTFRLRGKGMPGKDGNGDLYATVDIILPAESDAALTALMRQRKANS
ncbi:MAG: DnaJ C-terminal domain-containing protein [Beijerinckiaceae bacterium]